MRLVARQAAQHLADAFWLIPAVLILGMGGAGVAVVGLQNGDALPGWIPQDLVYGGGETGARTLLGVVATSSIAVAGTIFSVTLAALSLASNQLGPRLLRNFTRDRGNQVTLGVLLGAFVYSTIVLRSVRGGADEFVPSVGVTVALLIAGGCVATLVYFVHHVANRINVDTVVSLVCRDVAREIDKLPSRAEASRRPNDDDLCHDGHVVTSDHGAYLLAVDCEGLRRWALNHNVNVRILHRPGDFVLRGAPLARVSPGAASAEHAIRRSISFSAFQPSGDALAYAIQQLVSVAVRALSPGINDPLTAIMVIDRLAAILADLNDRDLPSLRIVGTESARVLVPARDYEDYLGEAFGLILESAAASPIVLRRVVKVLGDIGQVERDPDRLNGLRRRAGRAMQLGVTSHVSELDLRDLQAAYRTCLHQIGPRGL
jgi:uncharacterized membrane protein